MTEKDADKISITPNPANGMFYILLNGVQDSKLNLKVLSQTGHLLLQKQYENAAGGLPLDLTSFTNGTYLLVVEIDNEKIYKRIQIVK